jgi:hypothetical protein
MGSLGKWGGVSAVLRLACSSLLAPGLLNVGRQLRHVSRGLREALPHVILVERLIRSDAFGFDQLNSHNPYRLGSLQRKGKVLA